MAYTPDKGDIVWVTFNPQAGHEQSGHRPALVISPRAYNVKVGLALFCPITNQIKGYPFEVTLPEDLGITGAVLSDQVKNLDWKARNAKFIKKLPAQKFNEVVSKLGTLISPI